MDGPLTPLEMERLKMFNYRRVGVSFLEPYFRGYWTSLAEHIPRTWPSASITVSGLITTILTTLPVFFYSLDDSYEVPRWCYLLCALGIFVYQVMDAVDGLQTRRTVGDNAWNVLFDHCCDAVSSVFITVGMCAALHLGGHPYWFLVVMFGSLTLVYLTQWQSYVTGIMPFGKFDVTELQWTMISIHVISVMFGSEIWETRVTFRSLESTVLNLLLFSTPLGAVPRCCSHLRIIFRERGQRPLCCAHSNITPLTPFLPLILMVISVVISYGTSSSAFDKNLCLFSLVFGLPMSKLIVKLVVHTCAESEMAVWDSCYMGPLCLIAIQNCVSIEDNVYVLWIVVVYNAYNLGSYFVRVAQQASDSVNMYCFCITSKPHPEREHVKNNMTVKK